MEFTNKKMYALGRLKQGQMNKTEAAYAQLLELRKSAGEVVWYTFEGIKFRLANKTFYTPDFILMLADRSIEVHEVKGYWQEDARVKIKVAAEMYPLFKFQAVKKVRSGWDFEEF